jgi:hypothetical protein
MKKKKRISFIGKIVIWHPPGDSAHEYEGIVVGQNLFKRALKGEIILEVQLRADSSKRFSLKLKDIVRVKAA